MWSCRNLSKIGDTLIPLLFSIFEVQLILLKTVVGTCKESKNDRLSDIQRAWKHVFETNGVPYKIEWFGKSLSETVKSYIGYLITELEQEV